MNKRTLFRAPALCQAGYGVHARQIFKWLMTRTDFVTDVQVLPWGNCPWIIDRFAMGGLIGKIMERTGEIKPPYDISFQLQLPNEWDVKLAKFNVGLTAAVETDKCNPEWVDCVNKMNLVIVPSQHIKTVLENSGPVKTKIVVIPEAFLDKISNNEIPPLELNLETNFNFLVFGQLTGDNELTDRKNTFKTIKWLCETFRNDKDVGIILKTNAGNNTTYDQQRCSDILKKYLAQYRKSLFPKFYLLHGDMEDKEVVGLYRNLSIKAFVSLTKGEGFGLPLVDAAASDLPIIATDWSGHLDFMNKGKWIKVNYDLVNIDKSRVDGKIFIEGTKWAEAREISTKKVFKNFRESFEIPKEWAKELGIIIRQDYSQDAINKLYDSVMTEALK